MAKRPNTKRVAFLGGGNMAEALIRGLLAAKYCAPADLVVSDVAAPRLADLKKRFGVTTAANAAAAAMAETVVVAVKPGQVRDVLRACGSALAGKLVLSIAAGVSLAALRAAAPQARFVRVMPNTPALVGAGMSVLVAGEGVGAAERKRALQIFTSVGKAVEAAAESQLDAVTGLSGSGPAYVFVLLEALADGGVKAGLPRALARDLAAQTVFGSAKLALESGKHPAELKDQVASPGGTTIAGLHALETAGFRAAAIEAVLAATERSKELGKG
jgi:pyrroline-5-carboxylate reductase